MRFALLSYSEELWNIFEIVLEKCVVFKQNSLSLKKIYCLCANLPTVKILGQSDKFNSSFSSLHCPFEVKKLIGENSAKYVNQTGNFYFRPKLKTAISLAVFNLFQ